MALFDRITQPGSVIRPIGALGTLKSITREAKSGCVVEKKSRPVRIFWDDVLAIESIFKENFDDYIIVADKIEYGSSDELLISLSKRTLYYLFQRKNRARKLTFISDEPYCFRLEMSRDKTTFFSKIDDGKFLTITEQIKNKLQSKVLPDTFYNTFFAQKGIHICLLIFLLLLLIINHKAFKYFELAIIIVNGFMLMCTILGRAYQKPVLTIKREMFRRYLHAGEKA
jgi:hypothetical protein